MARFRTGQGVSAVGSFLGIRNDLPYGPATPEAKLIREASPVWHITADDSPILLMHGDRDETVPFEQAELMRAALERAKAPFKMLRIPAGGHAFPGDVKDHPDWPNVNGEAVSWFNERLASPPLLRH